MMLRAMPPTALLIATLRRRRAMWRSSSSFRNDGSRMTAPAASEVTSLLAPKAMAAVAASMAGASLMPSPR